MRATEPGETPFDSDDSHAAAKQLGATRSLAERAGRRNALPHRGLIVASRDTSSYEAGGLRVVDPWQS
jgi:hypothetical protein